MFNYIVGHFSSTKLSVTTKLMSYIVPRMIKIVSSLTGRLTNNMIHWLIEPSCLNGNNEFTWIPKTIRKNFVAFSVFTYYKIYSVIFWVNLSYCSVLAEEDITVLILQNGKFELYVNNSKKIKLKKTSFCCKLYLWIISLYFSL